MSRVATIRRPAFTWLPRIAIPQSDIQINGESVYTTVLLAECSRALCPETGMFNISLDNNNSEYTDKYNQGDEVTFFTDLVDGTTQVFKGKINLAENPYGEAQGFILSIKGNHISTDDLIKTHVTLAVEKNTLTFTEILELMRGTFLAGRGYTLNVTATSTDKPKINWDSKPFWDCVFDLTKLAGADSYVDDDLEIQFFDKGSIVNLMEAIFWNDLLISSQGIGKQTSTNRDRIIVQGEDGTGLPILSTSGTGIKEEVIFDSKIDTFANALSVGNAQLNFIDTENTEGSVNAFILPTIRPGQKVWMSDPPIGIREQIKIYKYTHKFPIDRTGIIVDQGREVSLIFKERFEKELALQTLTNPFLMLESWNIKFDSEDEILTKDSNVGLSEGKVKLTSGVEGTLTARNNFTRALTSIHLLVVGSDLIGTVYQIKKSSESDSAFQTITTGVKINLNSINTGGTQFDLKISFNSATTEIDSIAILGK